MTALAVPPQADDAPAVALGTPRQLSHVVADLLPDEIVAKRRLGHLQRRLVFGVCALVLMVVLGYALSLVQTRNAQDGLAAEQANATGLNARVGSFARLTRVQAETQTIQGELAGVMTNDLPWGTLLRTVAAKAPAGVQITGVDGSVTGPGGADTGGSSESGLTLNPSGAAVVGTLTLTGTAPRISAVADYLQILGRLPGLVAADPSSTEATAHGLTFTIELAVTTKALHGRFTAQALPGAPTGGN